MSRKNTVAKVGKDVVTLADDGHPVDLKFPDNLHTVKEAAKFLRCSTASLNKWRLTGAGPHFIYVGRRVRYRAADLAAFITNSTRLSTSDRGVAA